tara:strand:+ start:38 stop:451 length:414 start_codon:yes stop_codon:yes gene_type:complete
MLEEIKNIKMQKKDFRSFGLTFGIIFLLIAGFLLYKEIDLFKIFFIISIILFSSSSILPILLKPFYLVWMIFAVIIGWFMTRLILSALFYLIITPIGIAAKIFSKDFLDIDINYSKNSYWNLREKRKELDQDYEKQY